MLQDKRQHESCDDRKGPGESIARVIPSHRKTQGPQSDPPTRSLRYASAVLTY